MKLIKQKKEMSTTKRIYGLYGDDDDLMHGVKLFRDKGIEIAEVYTPFPVHGLDKALGLKKPNFRCCVYLCLLWCKYRSSDNMVHDEPRLASGYWW